MYVYLIDFGGLLEVVEVEFVVEEVFGLFEDGFDDVVLFDDFVGGDGSVNEIF